MKKKSRKSVEDDDEIVELPKLRRSRAKKAAQEEDDEVQEVKPTRRSSVGVGDPRGKIDLRFIT